MTDAERELLLGQGHDGFLTWSSQVHLAETLGWSFAKVEEAALEEGLLPSRYARNHSTFSTGDQLSFLRARVGVVGCGGIGGYVVEGLARLGIGTIVVADPDSFDESNLNRQLFSSIAAIGMAKVEAAAARIPAINPAATLVPHRERLTRDNGAALLKDCGAVVDALNSIAARLELLEVCGSLGIPMVHGAIAGWYPTFRPVPGRYGTGPALRQWRRGWRTNPLGQSPFTPMAAAAFQIAEVCKILTGQGRQLRGRVLMFDLCEGMVEDIGFASGKG